MGRPERVGSSGGDDRPEEKEAMNNMSWLIMELLAQQALREQELRSQHLPPVWHEPRDAASDMDMSAPG